MTEHEKKWIDNATFEELYRKVRLDPIGSPWLSGRTGEYFMRRFNEAKSLVSSEERIRISKKIGWR